MSKKDKSKPSPFGLPSFKKEQKEERDSTNRVFKNVPDEIRRILEEGKKLNKNK